MSARGIYVCKLWGSILESDAPEPSQRESSSRTPVRSSGLGVARVLVGFWVASAGESS